MGRIHLHYNTATISRTVNMINNKTKLLQAINAPLNTSCYRRFAVHARVGVVWIEESCVLSKITHHGFKIFAFQTIKCSFDNFKIRLKRTHSPTLSV